MANKRRFEIEIGAEQKGSGFKDTAADADKLAKDIDAAGKKAKGAFTGLEKGAAGVGSKLQAARRDASGAFQGIENDARGMGSKIADAGRIAGDKLGESISQGAEGALDDFGSDVKETLGTLGGVGAGVGFAAAFTEGLDRGASADVMSAALGLSEDQARVAGDVAGSLYANAYGDSMEEVHTAIDAVGSTLTSVTAGSADDLERLSTKALDVSNVFGTDVTEMVSLAGVAIRHGLADDADHAFDLITAAMQRMPAGMREELIPTIEEYGSFLTNMGFSGEEAFGLLAAASQDGTFEIDKTGDAIKELSIRATDMSATSVAAYQAAGLSAEDMAARFLEGGDVARGALDELITGLLSIEDPTARANAAIALFGTPIEDLSVNEIPQFLERLQSANTSLGDVAGAAEEAGAIVNDNLKTRLTELQRRGLAPVITLTDTVARGFLALPGPLQAAIGGIGGLAAISGPAIWAGKQIYEAWNTALDVISNLGGRIAAPTGAIEGAFNGVTTGASRFGTAIRGIAGAAGTLGILAVSSELISNLVNPVDTANLSELENALLDVAESGEISGEAAEVMGEDFDKLAGAMHRVAEPSTADRVKDSLGFITTFGQDTRSLEQARQRIDDVDQAIATLAGRDPEIAARVFDRITAAMEDQGISTSQVRDLFDDYSSALAQSDTASRTAAGGANEVAGAMRDEADATGDAIAQLQQHADTLRAQFDPIFGMMDALRASTDARIEVHAAQNALNEAIRDSGPRSREAREAQAQLTAAHQAATGAALDVTGATAQLNAAIAGNPALLQESKNQLIVWVSQGLISEETARQMARQFDLTAAEARDLGNTDPNVRVTTSGVGATVQNLEEILRIADRVDTAQPVLDLAVRVGGPMGMITALVGGGQRERGGPVDAGRLYEVAEHGKAELLEMAGRTFLIPGSSGTVIPADDMADSPLELAAVGAGGGGGGDTYNFSVTVDARGAVGLDEGALEEVVVHSLNRAVRNGRPIRRPPGWK